MRPALRTGVNCDSTELRQYPMGVNSGRWAASTCHHVYRIPSKGTAVEVRFQQVRSWVDDDAVYFVCSRTLLLSVVIRSAAVIEIVN